MKLKYCIDANVDEPIMLIDTHIGTDKEDGEGILGNEFSRELLFLDTLNKSKIQIWINSPGGAVIDGMAIYNTILNTKTKVDTYNMGVCASIAAVIFQAGRNRIMADYSSLMIHNPFMPIGDAKADKGLEAFKNSIITMIASRSGLSETECAKLMSEETWFNSEEALKMALCDEIELSSSKNKPRKTNTDAKAQWKQWATVLNKIIEEKKPYQMKNIAAKLKLNEAASEQSITEAIDAILLDAQNKTSDMKEMKEKMDKAKADYDDVKEKYDALKKDCDAKAALEETEKKEKEVEKNKAQAKTLVAEGVKLFKIQNKVEVIASYEKLAESNYEGTKEIIDALPVTRKGAILPEEKDKTAATGADDKIEIDINNTQVYINKMLAKK